MTHVTEMLAVMHQRVTRLEKAFHVRNIGPHDYEVTDGDTPPPVGGLPETKQGSHTAGAQNTKHHHPQGTPSWVKDGMGNWLTKSNPPQIKPRLVPVRTEFIE